MLTAAYWRTLTVLVAAFSALSARLAARHRATRATIGGRYGVVAARGVTFIEYALLAAIAVFIAWLFRTQLQSIFTSLLSKLRGGINSSGASS